LCLQTKRHWIIFVPITMLVIIALFMPVMLAHKFGMQGPNVGDVGITELLLLMIFFWGPCHLTRINSEYAVTNKRIIMKTGIIRLKSLEVFHRSQVAISVNQGIFGQLFNYGTIAIHGISTHQNFAQIHAPFSFKRAAELAIQKFSSH